MALLAAHHNRCPGIQYCLVVLIGIACLSGENVHRGAIPSLARFALDNRGHACQRIAGIDWAEVLVFLFAMQDAHDLDTNAHKLTSQARIAPEREHSWCRRRERHVLIPGCLSCFPAMINRIIVTNGKGQFVDFATLNLNSEGRKALADLTCIKHESTPSHVSMKP